jgi:hypothetical protein
MGLVIGIDRVATSQIDGQLGPGKPVESRVTPDRVDHRSRSRDHPADCRHGLQNTVSGLT